MQGIANAVAPVPPKFEDLAVLMYTSGSTGVPKVRPPCGGEFVHELIGDTLGRRSFAQKYRCRHCRCQRIPRFLSRV